MTKPVETLSYLWKLCESSGVDIHTVETSKAWLQIICEGYADEDKQNTNETEIFWPSKT